ncbi:P-II family nitrogen regulator [bacterium]|nr:P-II family nitrogen regulator [bacterium]
MKKIEAFIQPEQFENVKKELFAANVSKMSVSQVKGCGRQSGYTESFRGQVVEINLLQKTKIEIAVNDAFVKPTIDAIIRGARTGSIGDGKIFVLDLPQCYRVRTGEEGEDAVG